MPNVQIASGRRRVTARTQIKTTAPASCSIFMMKSRANPEGSPKSSKTGVMNVKIANSGPTWQAQKIAPYADRRQCCLSNSSLNLPEAPTTSTSGSAVPGGNQ